MLAALGFKALATTSSGFAFTLGRLDGDVDARRGGRARRGARPRRPTLPVSVDLENGYGAGPGERRAGDRARRPRPARSAARSRTTTPSGRLYELDHAAERVAAAAEAARGLGFPFTLTARAENHIRGNPDLDDTIARLQAYEEAGADVLYAPGPADGRRDPRGLRGGREAGQRARAAAACRWPRSSRRARSGSASAAG